jgi:hypothetical protein
MYDQDFKQDVGVMSFPYQRQGGYEWFTPRGTGYAPQGRPARH